MIDLAAAAAAAAAAEGLAGEGGGGAPLLSPTADGVYGSGGAEPGRLIIVGGDLQRVLPPRRLVAVVL